MHMHKAVALSLCVLIVAGIDFFTEKINSVPDRTVEVKLLQTCADYDGLTVTLFIDDAGDAILNVASHTYKKSDVCELSVSVEEGFNDPIILSSLKDGNNPNEYGNGFWDASIALDHSAPNIMTPTSYYLNITATEAARINRATFVFRPQYSWFHVKDASSDFKTSSVAHKAINWSIDNLTLGNFLAAEVLTEPLWLTQYRSAAVVFLSALLGSLVSILISETSVKAAWAEFLRRWRRTKYYGTGQDPE